MNEKKYIERCEKAEEIQRDREDEYGSEFALIRNNGEIETVFFVGWGAERILETAEGALIKQEQGDRLIYLPTQEQLQKKVDLRNYVEFRIKPKLRGSEYYYEMGYNPMYGKDFSDFESRYVHGENMRDLWLAFVMYEKYNKFWDGNDWKI